MNTIKRHGLILCSATFHHDAIFIHEVNKVVWFDTVEKAEEYGEVAVAFKGVDSYVIPSIVDRPFVFVNNMISAEAQKK